MQRSYLANYLYDHDCSPDSEEFDSEAGQIWINDINGETCNIPWDEELESTTWAHVCYELGVPPPVEYDSDYYIYTSFREVQLNQKKQTSNTQSGE